MINRNKLSGTFYAVIISLLLITISKINSLQNTIDNFKITIDEIAYTPVKEKMMYRSDGTYSPITIKALQRTGEKRAIIRKDLLVLKGKLHLFIQICPI